MSVPPDGRSGGSSPDAKWGRLPGARPPLGARGPLLWWLITSVLLTVVVLAVVGGPGPLDDPDPGEQRAGFLIDSDQGRSVAGLRLPGDPVGRRPVFPAFDRSLGRDGTIGRVLDDVPPEFAAVLVVPRLPGPGVRAALAGRFRVQADPGGSVGRAVGMPQPKDGGPPIGYALIDDSARVRYATLDPTWIDHGDEIGVVAGPLE